MPPIGALAFTPDGSQLWTATRGSIEIRTWPELSLVAVVPWTRSLPPRVEDGLPTGWRQALAFHPAGRVAALAYRSQVFLLDGEGRLRGGEPIAPPAGVCAIAFDGQGRLLIANPSGVFSAAPSGALSPVGVPPNGPIPVWIWRAAIAPAAHRVVYAVNDEPALVYSWDSGEVVSDEAWAGEIFTSADREGARDGSSWLAVDVAPGERALVCGRKSGATWVVRVGPNLQPTSACEANKPNVRRPEKEKLPMRTTAHAIHPTEDAFLYVEISGYVVHARLSTGEIVRELPRAGGGYAWF